MTNTATIEAAPAVASSRTFFAVRVSETFTDVRVSDAREYTHAVVRIFTAAELERAEKAVADIKAARAAAPLIDTRLAECNLMLAEMHKKDLDLVFTPVRDAIDALRAKAKAELGDAYWRSSVVANHHDLVKSLEAELLAKNPELAKLKRDTEEAEKLCGRLYANSAAALEGAEKHLARVKRGGECEHWSASRAGAEKLRAGHYSAKHRGDRLTAEQKAARAARIFVVVAVHASAPTKATAIKAAKNAKPVVEVAL